MNWDYYFFSFDHCIQEHNCRPQLYKILKKLLQSLLAWPFNLLVCFCWDNSTSNICNLFFQLPDDMPVPRFSALCSDNPSQSLTPDICFQVSNSDIDRGFSARTVILLTEATVIKKNICRVLGTVFWVLLEKGLVGGQWTFLWE